MALTRNEADDYDKRLAQQQNNLRDNGQMPHELEPLSHTPSIAPAQHLAQQPTREMTYPTTPYFDYTKVIQDSYEGEVPLLPTHTPAEYRTPNLPLPEVPALEPPTPIESPIPPRLVSSPQSTALGTIVPPIGLHSSPLYCSNFELDLSSTTLSGVLRGPPTIPLGESALVASMSLDSLTGPHLEATQLLPALQCGLDFMIINATLVAGSVAGTNKVATTIAYNNISKDKNCERTSFWGEVDFWVFSGREVKRSTRVGGGSALHLVARAGVITIESASFDTADIVKNSGVKNTRAARITASITFTGAVGNGTGYYCNCVKRATTHLSGNLKTFSSCAIDVGVDEYSFDREKGSFQRRTPPVFILRFTVKAEGIEPGYLAEVVSQGRPVLGIEYPRGPSGGGTGEMQRVDMDPVQAFSVVRADGGGTISERVELKWTAELNRREKFRISQVAPRTRELSDLKPVAWKLDVTVRTGGADAFECGGAIALELPVA